MRIPHFNFNFLLFFFYSFQLLRKNIKWEKELLIILGGKIMSTEFQHGFINNQLYTKSFFFKVISILKVYTPTNWS